MWVSLHTCIILNKDSDDVSALHVQLHGLFVGSFSPKRGLHVLTLILHCH